MAAIGLLAVLARQPWLFPSLGPTIFLQVMTPNEPAARPWNTLAGHAAGIAAGFAALFLCAAAADPPALSTEMLTGGRAAATALAVGLTIALQIVLRAQHAPAAATTMVITLGALKPTTQTVAHIVVGVILVTLLGEAARWLHPHRKQSSAPDDKP
jgi:CBS-domain-containing membrane protein